MFKYGVNVHWDLYLKRLGVKDRGFGGIGLGLIEISLGLSLERMSLSLSSMGIGPQVQCLWPQGTNKPEYLSCFNWASDTPIANLL